MQDSNCSFKAAASISAPMATIRVRGTRSPQSSSSTISVRRPTAWTATRFPGVSAAKTMPLQR